MRVVGVLAHGHAARPLGAADGVERFRACYRHLAHRHAVAQDDDVARTVGVVADEDAQRRRQAGHPVLEARD